MKRSGEQKGLPYKIYVVRIDGLPKEYSQIVRRKGPLGHPLGLLPRPPFLGLLLLGKFPALLGGGRLLIFAAGAGHGHVHGHRRPLPVLIGDVVIHQGR